MNRVSALPQLLGEAGSDTSTGASSTGAALLVAAVLLFIASASALSTAVRGMLAAVAALATVATGLAKFMLIALVAALLIVTMMVNRGGSGTERPGRTGSSAMVQGLTS